MNGLDLFSGIGGIAIGLEPWVRTVAYCESDEFAQRVLLSRMHSGDLDRAPIFTDVRELRGEHFADPIDIITGGFPCQDISSAGSGQGLDGKRSGLFFEIIRLVDELRPSFVFLENVAAITHRGLDRIVGELTLLRYDCRWSLVSADDVGAPHFRQRWFLLAHADGEGQLQQARSFGEVRRRSDNGGKEGWLSVPHQGVPYLVNGIPVTVDEQRAFGNACIPAQAREAFEKLAGIKG